MPPCFYFLCACYMKNETVKVWPNTKIHIHIALLCHTAINKLYFTYYKIWESETTSNLGEQENVCACSKKLSPTWTVHLFSVWSTGFVGRVNSFDAEHWWGVWGVINSLILILLQSQQALWYGSIWWLVDKIVHLRVQQQVVNLIKKGAFIDRKRKKS